MNILDTLIWLINFPVRHGYAMAFIAGFSLMGLVVLAFRRVGGTDSRLSAVRESEGLPETRRTGGARVVAAHVQRLVFRILAVLMLAGLALGILGLTGAPVTSAYIHTHGVTTTGTADGDWVTFSTPGGETYTLESSFFTPASYPDRLSWMDSDAPVVVRYLPSHPQAFVVDTTQLPE